ncbi:hypothetical protein TNCV_4657771 [Trichonephila clavipes]|nr:hypothetical protein TNCV_4657771 [Trichonephila clavipes]
MAFGHSLPQINLGVQVGTQGGSHNMMGNEKKYSSGCSIAVEVSTQPRLNGIVRGRDFLHVLRRRRIGCPDSRRRSREFQMRLI